MLARLNASRPARIAATLGLAAAGGGAATFLGIPAGWLAGGILAVALASVAGLRSEVPDRLRPPVYLFLGVVAGSGVGPETLAQMATWPASFLVLAVSVALLIAATYSWLRRGCGWDSHSALMSSLPGAMALVLAAAEGTRADMRKVAFTQTLRLLILVELIPLAALLIGLPDDTAAGTARAEVAPLDLLLLAVAGIAGGLLAQRLRLPGGLMIGGLLASAALFLSGAVDTALPRELSLPAVVALAAIGGSRFRPGDARLVPEIGGAALVAFLIGIAISFAAALTVSLGLGVNLIQALLAFAPGALDALIIVAFALDIDPAYVAAHHVARFFALAVSVPFVARWVARR